MRLYSRWRRRCPSCTILCAHSMKVTVSMSCPLGCNGLLTTMAACQLWSRKSSLLDRLVQVPAKEGETNRLPDPLRPGAEDTAYDDPKPRRALAMRQMFHAHARASRTAYIFGSLCCCVANWCVDTTSSCAGTRQPARHLGATQTPGFPEGAEAHVYSVFRIMQNIKGQEDCIVGRASASLCMIRIAMVSC